MKLGLSILLILCAVFAVLAFVKNRCPEDTFFVADTHTCVPFRNEVQKDLYNK